VLNLLRKLRIRTLIDSGAMILEMSNLDLVKGWLEIDSTATAAVYFNSKDEAMVRYRTGKEMLLLVSNLTDLSDVLVYIGKFSN
jgi:hypothetical protein